MPNIHTMRRAALLIGACAIIVPATAPASAAASTAGAQSLSAPSQPSKPPSSQPPSSKPISPRPISPTPPAELAKLQQRLSIEQRTALRCGAAFALLTRAQKDGDANALKYPDLEARGREYFVLSSVQVMDDTGMSAEEVGQVVIGEVVNIAERGGVNDIMPSCVVLLDNSGL